MFRNWITPLALCASIVGIGGSGPLSESSLSSRGENVSPSVIPSGGSSAIRALQGDPPPLPAAANPATSARRDERQPATALGLSRPKLGNLREPRTPAQLPVEQGHGVCPFGTDTGFRCDYESRAETAAKCAGRPLPGILEPTIPVRYRCEAGSCPLNLQLGRGPSCNLRP